MWAACSSPYAGGRPPPPGIAAPCWARPLLCDGLRPAPAAPASPAPGAADALRVAEARVVLAEAEQREGLLLSERSERVAFVREVLILLHLERTEWERAADAAQPHSAVTQRGAAPDGGRTPRRPLRALPQGAAHSGPPHGGAATPRRCAEVQQAQRWGTGLLPPGTWLAAVQREEAAERRVLAHHEAEAAQTLGRRMLPLARRIISAISQAHSIFAAVEARRRDDVAREEEKGWERLRLDRQVFGNTLRVLKQYSEENDRAGAIGQKLSLFGWRSCGGSAPGSGSASPPPADRSWGAAPWPAGQSPPGARHAPISPGPGGAAGGERRPAAAAAEPPGEPATPAAAGSAVRSPPNERLRALQEDTEFLEGHVMGLRTLRNLESDKLQDLQAQLAAMDDVLRQRRRELAELDSRLARTGASPQRRPGAAGAGPPAVSLN